MFRSDFRTPRHPSKGNFRRGRKASGVATLKAVSSGSARFVRFAWGFLAYLIAVILFGAWVRISHSGAGCGSHWPTCNGAIVPLDPSAAALIEYTHRLSSGLCGILGIVLLVWAWQAFGKGRVTAAAGLTLLFIVFEGAIGAGLVLGGLTADDDSAMRAAVIALHLVNTLFLTACAALCLRWAQAPEAARRVFAGRAPAFALGMAAFVLTAASGAVTALGDTLFASAEVIDAGHFLVRLRIVHPVLAVAAAGYLLWLLAPQAPADRWAKAALHTTGAQVALGFLNIALSAPAWLQIVHLLAANVLWICLVVAAGARTANRRPAET